MRMIVCFLLMCATVCASDYNRCLFVMEQAGIDHNSVEWAMIDANADGIPESWWVDSPDAPLWSVVVSVDTSSVEFVEWLAQRNQPAADLAAEVASLESDLTNAVNVAFGVMPPYSENVQGNYRTLLRNQMKQARADVAAATSLADLRAAQETLNQRQQIINLIREILALKPDWTLGDL